MSAGNTTTPDADGPALAAARSKEPVTFAESFSVWLRVSLLSFGGPAAQIAVMHRIIVDEKKWLNESRFLHALNFCMLLPGPEAQQLATYIGWLMHGIRGGLMAGLLFILPGFVSMLFLSLLYVSFLDSTAIQSLFLGLRCAVLAVVAEAVLRVSRRVLKNRVLKAISVIAFLLMWLKLLPFPAVIALAGIVGLVGHKVAPNLFCLSRRNDASDATVDAQESSGSISGDMGRSLVVAGTCLVLWFSPILLAAHFAGNNSVYVKSALFFSKAAVVTFGGAYSVLSYVDQQAVEKYHWLEKGEMADGLGLAETTPGPLIMVVQFVGFLAAWRHGTELPPLLAGTLGAVLTTWVTFVPCFLWIFLGAPWVEKLLHKQWLSTALTVITASVVGVIATLGVNMAFATLFSRLTSVTLSWLPVQVPVWSSIQPASCGITALALVLTLVLHRSLTITLLSCVIAGLLLRVAGLAPL
jgi:chromate transporter